MKVKSEDWAMNDQRITAREPKKYTLEEAYEEICRIREQVTGGYKEYQDKQEQMAYERGYRQAIIDLETDIHRRSQLLLAINTSRP